jgi:hypothetical protein
MSNMILLVMKLLALLLLLLLLNLLLLLLLLLELMGKIHMHRIALTCRAAVHHYVLSWLVALIEHSVRIMSRGLGTGGMGRGGCIRGKNYSSRVDRRSAAAADMSTCRLVMGLLVLGDKVPSSRLLELVGTICHLIL